MTITRSRHGLRLHLLLLVESGQLSVFDSLATRLDCRSRSERQGLANELGNLLREATIWLDERTGRYRGGPDPRGDRARCNGLDVGSG